MVDPSSCFLQSIGLIATTTTDCGQKVSHTHLCGMNLSLGGIEHSTMVHTPTFAPASVPQISAKKGTGVDDLLEQLLLVAEVGASWCPR